MKIALCGSARFETEFIKANQMLTLNGHTVYGLAVYPSQKEAGKDWYTEEQKHILDLMHLSKIEESDAIYICTDPTGYIGFSTRREIAWAMIRTKLILSEYTLNCPALLPDYKNPSIPGINYAWSLQNPVHMWQKFVDPEPETPSSPDDDIPF